MNLAQFSVSRPVAASIINIALLLMGLFLVKRMPVSLYPEVNIPFIAITVPFPGAAPEQIEAKLIKPLEKELAGLKGLNRVIGRAIPSAAVLVLGFKMGSEENNALESVREKVSIVSADFPKGVEDPIIRRIDFGATPILIFGVDSKLDTAATKKLLENSVIPNIERVDGVREAEVLGIGEEQLELKLDPQKLSSLRVSPLELFELLSAQTSIVPWGELEQSDQTITVARDILPNEPEYWNNFDATLRDSRGIRLSEVGNTSTVFNDAASDILINGKPGLSLVITKRAEANTVDTIAKVTAAVQKGSLPAEISLFPIINQATYINANSHEVWIALFVGGAFAVLVILFFLTDVKSAMISATALPVSVAGAFLFMYMLGFSINMLTLLALALAIGLLIDDAVVVRESIYQELEHGFEGAEAAVRGTDKVATAVLATTLAVVAVFLPVAMMGGMVGQFFKQFGITICIAVSLSLFVAFTLDPMLSAKFAGKPEPLKGKFWDSWRAFLDKTEAKIIHLAKWAYARPLRVIVTSILMLVFSVALALSRGSEFLAFEDRDQFLVSLQAPPGTTKSENLELVEQVSRELQSIPGVTQVFAQTRQEQDPLSTLVRVVCLPKTKRKEGVLELQKQARAKLAPLQISSLVMDPPPIEGVGAEAPLSVYVYGENLEELRRIAEGVRAQIEKVPGVASARIETPGFSESLEISLRNNEMGFLGTNSQTVEATGRLTLTGLEIGSVGEENTPFWLRVDKDGRQLETLVNQVLVPTLRGPESLGRFADFKEDVRPTTIEREKRSRKMVIFGSLDRTETFGNVLEDVEKVISKVEKPYWAEIAGDKEFFDEMIGNFTLAFFGSLFFIFIVLAIQFENLFRPFVILLSLPLAIIGGLLALFLAGQQLAMGAMIGFILLIGLAAKNGILLVDAIGTLEKKMGLSEAVSEGVKIRSRAILMTSLAMIFGMIPTAVLRGAGSEFRAPMAIAIIGGVVSSTLLSFVVIPAIFGLVSKAKTRRLNFQSAVLVAFAFLTPLLAQRNAQAQEPVEKSDSSNFTVPKATMSEVILLVKDLPPVSAESTAVESAQAGADGARSASKLAFLGGAKIEVGREWANPGYIQTVTLPLPAALGGPRSVNNVIIPKVQNVVTVGWQIPLFNVQVWEGLNLTNHLLSQVQLVRNAKRESATLSYAQTLLQYELALQTVKLNERYLKNAEARLKIARDKRVAGTGRKIDESDASITVQSTIATLEQARAEAERLRVIFYSQTNRQLPEGGLGIPSFPLRTDAQFSSAAVRALQGAFEIQFATQKANEASFFPTVGLELAHSRQRAFENELDPQNIIALRAQWNILDGGARIRSNAQTLQAALDLLSQKQTIERDMRANHATLKIRQEGLERQLSAVESTQDIAASAVKQATDAYRAGLATANDLRTAEEGKLKSDFAFLQVQFALQALAIESLALTENWLTYLDTN